MENFCFFTLKTQSLKVHSSFKRIEQNKAAHLRFPDISVRVVWVTSSKFIRDNIWTHWDLFYWKYKWNVFCNSFLHWINFNWYTRFFLIKNSWINIPFYSYPDAEVNVSALNVYSKESGTNLDFKINFNVWLQVFA